VKKGERERERERERLKQGEKNKCALECLEKK